MLTIKCARCGKKLFKYLKIGKGELHICIKSRIEKDFTVKEGNLVKCPSCGNIIGIDMGMYIKLKKNQITYSGTKNP
jgi:ribosomal protein S27E